jgi:hypothetical protein
VQYEPEEQEEETTDPFETPLHSTMPRLVTIPKALERAPTRSSPWMLPRPEHVPSMASGIPMVWPKREMGKPSTSQSGKGQKHITEE